MKHSRRIFLAKIILSSNFYPFISPFSHSTARKGFGPGEQEWGYVKVRSASHMFWWLYYTTANVSSYYEKPLIIWLQGGPGASSTSYGNFEELGPLDVDLKPRNFSWVGGAIVPREQLSNFCYNLISKRACVLPHSLLPFFHLE